MRVADVQFRDFRSFALARILHVERNGDGLIQISACGVTDKSLYANVV